MPPLQLARHVATRYVQPLREGGSLPAVVDTETGGLLVVKFRGAGQGAKVLVAELIVGLLAQSLELPIPELALVDVSDRFGRSEPDPEIQELLRRSHGINVGARYLEGAFNFDAVAAGDLLTPELAAPHRLARRVHDEPRSHPPQPQPARLAAAPLAHRPRRGALCASRLALGRRGAHASRSFPLIRSHVLLAAAGDLAAADAECAALITPNVIAAVVDAVPDELYLDNAGGPPEFASAADARDRYRTYLTRRLMHPRSFAAEAIAAQGQVRREPPLHLSARR